MKSAVNEARSKSCGQNSQSGFAVSIYEGLLRHANHCGDLVEIRAQLATKPRFYRMALDGRSLLRRRWDDEREFPSKSLIPDPVRIVSYKHRGEVGHNLFNPYDGLFFKGAGKDVCVQICAIVEPGGKPHQNTLVA